MIGLYLLLVVCVQTSHGRTLKMVHLVYRHGARSPITFYPKDKIQEKDWPDGTGRLTQKGMNMEYNLGKFLKKRYILDKSFINQTYIHTQVYIRSSDVERCLQSAESQLAGFYPPSGYQIWNTAIPWQPIPVHTVPKDEDAILRPDDINCPRREIIWRERKKSPEYQQKIKKNEALFKKLSHFSGMNVTSINIGHISDTTICEITQGMEMPKWMKGIWNKTLNLSTWFFVDRFRGNDELGRLLGGSFLGKINDNMYDIVTGKDLQSLYKMNIFSGHDTSLLALSTALDINIDVPNFSACIMIELYHTDDGYMVEMLYRNNFKNTLQKLKLKNCDFSCPLQDFIKLTSVRTTRNLNKICQIEGSFLSMRNLKLWVLIFSCITVLLLAIIIFYFVRRSKLGYKGKLFMAEGEHLISDHT